MKITKRRWFFRLLGIFILAMLAGVILTGCDLGGIIVGGGLVLGGVIGAQTGHIFIGIIIGGISAFIIAAIIGSVIKGKSSSSSSSSPSIGASMKAWEESRKKDPHTCGNCTNYSSTKGECRRNGSSKSAGDSCSNWA